MMRGQPLTYLNTLWVVCHFIKIFSFKCFTGLILLVVKRKKKIESTGELKPNKKQQQKVKVPP